MLCKHLRPLVPTFIVCALIIEQANLEYGDLVVGKPYVSEGGQVSVDIERREVGIHTSIWY